MITKQILKSTKTSLFELGDEAIKKGLLDYIFTSLPLAAITTQASISIPLIAGLFVAYTGFKYCENKEKYKFVGNELQNRYNEIRNYLAQIRETQITELSKTIETQLTQKQLHGLILFLKDELCKQDQELQNICDNIDFSSTILKKLEKTLSGKIESLAKTIHQTKENTKDIIQKIDKNHTTTDQQLKEILKTLKQPAPTTAENDARILDSVFNISNEEPIVTGVDSEFDKIINIISRDISHNRITAALSCIEKIFQNGKYADSKKADIWLSAMRGHALLFAGQELEAFKELEHSKNLLSNKNANNTDNTSLQLIYACGYASKGEKDKALAIVEYLIKYDSKKISPSVRALWVILCDLPFNSIESLLSEEEKNHFKITEALARKAQAEKLYIKAEYYAGRSIELSKKINRVPNYIILAEVLLSKKFGSIICAGFSKRPLKKKDWPDFMEITKCYTLMLEEVKPYASSIFISRIIYNIALTHYVVDDHIEAEAYIDALSKLDKIDALALNASLMMLFKMGKIEKAISICRRREEKILKVPHLILRYASFLFSLESTERAKAFNILSKYISEYKGNNEPIYIEATILYGSELIHDKLDKEIKNLYDILESNGGILQLKILQSIQEFQKKEFDKTRLNILVNETISLLDKTVPLDSDSHENMQCRTNIILNMFPLLKASDNLKLYLKLIDEFIPRDEVTDIGQNFINLAIDVADYNRLKKYFLNLRDNGYYDWAIIELEIQVSIKISKMEAEVLVNHLHSMPQLSAYKKELNVYLSLLEYDRGVLVLTHNEYPDVLTIDKWFPYINVPILLKAIGQIKEAIEYAYLLYKRYPNEKEVKEFFINFIFFSDLNSLISAPNEVTSDCVVKYNIQNIFEQYIVIDDTPFNDENRNEYSSGHELSKLLIGKRIGSEFDLGGLGQRVCKITHIENKYLFRLNQLMESEASQPNNSGLMLIKAKRDEQGNPDFSDLTTQISFFNGIREKRINNARNVYTGILSSVYAFSYISGLSLMNCLHYFAQQEDFYIYTNLGIEEEYDKCYELLKNSNKIVISPLTIEILIQVSALFNLDICNILQNTQFKFFISEYLLYDLKMELKHYHPMKRLYIIDNKPYASEDDMNNKHYKSLEKIVNYLNSVEIIPGNLIEDEFLPSSSLCKNFITRATYHSLQIVSSGKYTLWEDDINIVRVFNNSGNNICIKKRIFTHVLFSYFSRLNYMTSDELAICNVFLLSINEFFVRFDANTIKKIFLDDQNFIFLQKRIFKYIQLQSTNISSIISVVTDALVKIWAESYNLKILSLIIENLVKRDVGATKKVLEDFLIVSKRNDMKYDLLESFIKTNYDSGSGSL